MNKKGKFKGRHLTYELGLGKNSTTTGQERPESLAKFKKNKSVEDPKHFPQAHRILTVIYVGPGTQQVWDMLKEANCFIKISLQLAMIEEKKKNETIFF